MANVNYNHNITHNIDTASYKYNWLGQRKYTGTPGEQSNQNNEAKNKNWNGTLTANYRFGSAHIITLNHVLSTFERTTRSYVAGSSRLSDFSIPKRSRKNVTGLSYRFMPTEKWNATVFGKYYNQYNEGPVSQSDDGIGNYIQMSQKTSTFGYGAAGTYFILKNLQAKLSYEKAYRLPSTDELFGDEDLEAGRANLRPEKSDNVNFNLGYTPRFGKHGTVHGRKPHLPRHEGLHPSRIGQRGRYGLRILREPRTGQDQRVQRLLALQLCELVQPGREHSTAWMPSTVRNGWPKAHNRLR